MAMTLRAGLDTGFAGFPAPNQRASAGKPVAHLWFPPRSVPFHAAAAKIIYQQLQFGPSSGTSGIAARPLDERPPRA